MRGLFCVCGRGGVCRRRDCARRPAQDPQKEKGEAPLSACQRRLRASRLTTAHLHGASDESLVMHAAALAARAAADPCLIDLDVLIDATADAIPIRADHSGAKLVKKQY